MFSILCGSNAGIYVINSHSEGVYISLPSDWSRGGHVTRSWPMMARVWRYHLTLYCLVYRLGKCYKLKTEKRRIKGNCPASHTGHRKFQMKKLSDNKPPVFARSVSDPGTFSWQISECGLCWMWGRQFCKMWRISGKWCVAELSSNN